MVYSYIISLVLIFFPLSISPSELVLTGGKIYQPKETKRYYGKRNQLTRQQKLNQGITDKKKYTTCRLKKRLKSRSTGRQACIYEGGNKTYTLMYEDKCPRQYKCVYNPYGEEPNIDDVIDSLNSIKK